VDSCYGENESEKQLKKRKTKTTAVEPYSLIVRGLWQGFISHKPDTIVVDINSACAKSQ
jgi:hypothetical protein